MAGILEYSRANPWVGDSLQTLSQVLLALGTKQPELLNNIPQMLADRSQQRFTNERISRQDERAQKLFDMQVEEQNRTLNKDKARAQAVQGLLGGPQPLQPGQVPKVSDRITYGPNMSTSPDDIGQAPQGILSGYTPEQQSFLRTLGQTDPDAFLSTVGTDLLKRDDPGKPKDRYMNVGGALIDLLGDPTQPVYREPDKPADRITWSDILDQGGKPIGQRSSTGQLNYFPKQPGQAKTLTPEEAKAAGFSQGAVVQQKEDGTYTVVQKAPKDEPPRELKATELKELFDSQEAAKAGENAIAGLQQALTLSGTAASGRGAGVEKEFDAVFNPDQAASTAEFENILTSQVLDNLKAVFGGNPTEGERSALRELAGSINQTRAERKATLTRALDLAQKRLDFNRQRVQQIQEGNYTTSSPALPSDNDPLGIR